MDCPARTLRAVAGVVALLGLAVVSGGCGSFAAQGRNAEGVRLFDQARYQEAMEQFQLATSEDPNCADAYYNIGSVYHRLAKTNNTPGDLSQAENYYNLCLARDPSHCECYRGLAVLMVDQNRREEAMRLLQGWNDRNPLSPDPKIELARLSEELGDRDAAQQRLAEAVLIDSTNTRALAALGRLREQSGDSSLALQHYQQSLAADRFQPDVAARVAALQSAAGATQLSANPATGARLATNPQTPAPQASYR
jgi:Tfp pilus assembly protein PilF